MRQDAPHHAEAQIVTDAEHNFLGVDLDCNPQQRAEQDGGRKCHGDGDGYLAFGLQSERCEKIGQHRNARKLALVDEKADKRDGEADSRHVREGAQQQDRQKQESLPASFAWQGRQDEARRADAVL